MSLFQGPSKKIVVKIRRCSGAQTTKEVRKIVLNAADEPMTLDELCLMCQRIFHMPPSSQLSIKYVDADGDLISLTDNSDLVFALIDSDNYLKINIYQDEESIELRGDQVVMSNVKLQELKSEMKSVMTKLSSWIEQFDNMEEFMGPKIATSNSVPSKKEKRSKDASKHNASESVAIKSGAGREFDPLQQQQQQIQNSFNEIPNQGGVGPQGEKPPPEGVFSDNQVNDLSLESSSSAPSAQVNNASVANENVTAETSSPPDKSNFSMPAPSSSVANLSGSGFKPNVYPPSANMNDQLNNLDVSQLDDAQRNSAAPSPAVDNMQGVPLSSDQNSLNKQSGPPSMPQPPTSVNTFPGARPPDSPGNFMPPFMPPNSNMGMGNVNIPGPPPSCMAKMPTGNPLPPPSVAGQPPPPGQYMGPNFGPPPTMNGSMPPPQGGSVDTTRPPSQQSFNGFAPPPSPGQSGQGANIPGPPPSMMQQQPPFSMAGGVAPPPMAMTQGGAPPPSMNIPRSQMMFAGSGKYQAPSFKGSSTPLQIPSGDSVAGGNQMNNPNAPPMGGSPFMPPTNYPAPRGSSGMPPPPSSAAGPPPTSTGAPLFPHQPPPYAMGGQMMNPAMMRMPGPPPPAMPGGMMPPSQGGAPGNPMMPPPPMGMAYGGAPGAPSATGTGGSVVGGPPSMMSTGPPPSTFLPSI